MKMSRCWKLGDNVPTDEILPSRYMVLTNPSELGLHILESVKPGFARQLAKGDILVAGYNFGCGSSREHAPLALKGAGIGAIVAKSYARIFFRNCINIGIPAVVCPAAADRLAGGENAEINFESSTLTVHNDNDNGKSEIYHFDPFPPFILEYLSNGGLINTLNRNRAEIHVF
jgi:3-isopropylmalate/(R)-2-methylmalate dehydratase small subunit